MGFHLHLLGIYLTLFTFTMVLCNIHDVLYYLHIMLHMHISICVLQLNSYYLLDEILNPF